MPQTDTTSSSQNLATAIGFLAILMWSTLALLTDLSGKVPPFQLAAMTFAIGALVCLAGQMMVRSPVPAGRISPGVVMAGTIGLFAYHALYFTALRNAPAVDASLIAYLWPLLIVVGSALLPGERLRPRHIIGALCGFSGAALIISGRSGGVAFNPDFTFGYAVALVAAFTWATYSIAARRFPNVPSSVVTLYCAGSALLALIAHLAFETTIWPETTTQWLAVAGLGLLPVGAAFYVWDHGMKHGNIQFLGVASYAAPLFSTFILIAAGRTEPTWTILVACALISCGAMIAVYSRSGKSGVSRQ